jgi:hypothetical protein
MHKVRRQGVICERTAVESQRTVTQHRTRAPARRTHMTFEMSESLFAPRMRMTPARLYHCCKTRCWRLSSLLNGPGRKTPGIHSIRRAITESVCGTTTFTQTLHLEDGHIEIKSRGEGRAESTPVLHHEIGGCLCFQLRDLFLEITWLRTSGLSDSNQIHTDSLWSVVG